MFTRVGQPMLLCCDAICGEGSEREQCCLFCSLPVFSHFPCYPQSNWAILALVPGWWACECSRTLLVSPMNSPRGWELLLLLPQPPQVFSIRGLRGYFPSLKLWVVQSRSVLFPSCFSQFIFMRMWDCLVCNLSPCWVLQLQPCHGSPPCPAPCLCPSYQSG